jgi:hypothetical protein
VWGKSPKGCDWAARGAEARDAWNRPDGGFAASETPSRSRALSAWTSSRSERAGVVRRSANHSHQPRVITHNWWFVRSALSEEHCASRKAPPHTRGRAMGSRKEQASSVERGSGRSEKKLNRSGPIEGMYGFERVLASTGEDQGMS